MLYAALVRVSFGKSNRRIDLIVEADDLEQAKAKAYKQARKIFTPSKKATYSIVTIINEIEALESLTPQSTAPEVETSGN